MHFYRNSSGYLEVGNPDLWSFRPNYPSGPHTNYLCLTIAKAEIGARAWAVANSGVGRLARKLVRLVLIRRFCHLKRLLAIKFTISRKLSEIKSKTLVFYPGKAINIILLYNEATYKKNVSWTEFDVIKYPWVESTRMKIIWRTTCILLSCLLDFKCQTDKLEKKNDKLFRPFETFLLAEVFIWIPDLPFYERLKGNWINIVFFHFLLLKYSYVFPHCRFHIP